MNVDYRLEISLFSSTETLNSVTEILGEKPTYSGAVNEKLKAPNSWNYHVVVSDDDPYYDFINEFLDLLEGKYELLAKIGIERKDIIIWILYEYDQQCNLEFDPIRMKRLGDNGIGLCISCWDAGTESEVLK